VSAGLQLPSLRPEEEGDQRKNKARTKGDRRETEGRQKEDRRKTEGDRRKTVGRHRNRGKMIRNCSR
jgi:hypothetical protein